MDMILELSYNESNLIAACIRGEEWAQRHVYEENYSSMMIIALRYANIEEDALDILHDGFIKIFNNIHKYQLGSSFSAWIRRIMINAAIDYYRKEKRRKTEDLSTHFELDNKEVDVISKLEAEEILNALQQLSYSYRSVFNLHVIEGYSHREIAVLMNITESTCRSNLVKARHKLKDILLKTDPKLGR